MKIDVYCYDDINNPFCGGGGAFRDISIHKLLSVQHTVNFFSGNFPGARDYNEGAFSHRHIGSSISYLCSRITYSFSANIRALFSRADIIVVPFSIYAPVFTFLFRPKRTVVLFYHETGRSVLKKYGLAGYLPLLSEKTVFRHAKNIITLTNEMSISILSRYRPTRIKACFANFDESLLGISEIDERYILYFGRIDIHMKGLDVLIPAFDSIAARYPEYRLVIAGRGQPSNIAQLNDLIHSSAFSGRIEFVNNPDNDKKRTLYAACTLLCIPSRYEGWGIVAIEAGAMGKPVVATDIPNLRESVRNNDTGLLAQPESAEDLAEKIALLLKDASLRKKLGLGGYRWAQQFTLNKIALLQETFYAEVVAAAQ
ncbi:MAG: glycosyltransferase family 4 protein [Chitinispirillaceae bacterium]|jgi:glycosyltransferase involved in cell wall biosynthesis|nr:glycosyltransferase family 4 protein [Chitinispirillaceae bacterium]